MKVKLPKEVAKAVEHVKESQSDREQIIKFHCSDFVWTGLCEPLNHTKLDTLIRALYIGYEVEETPEEKVRELYENAKIAEKKCRERADGMEVNFYQGKMEGMKQTLDAYGYKIKGVNFYEF